MEQLQGPTGGRRANSTSLEQAVDSPVRRLSSLGSASFPEPLSRSAAEHYHSNDRRVERDMHSHVRFTPENAVPDVGGIGWRTKTGHKLKNQTYFNMKPKTNLWDLPAHAGTKTWKTWHGPKMRTDANMMEKLDQHDQEQEEWEAKKMYVNTTRIQTLDRLYNKKLQREQLQASSSWAPHQRSRREVHSLLDTFDADLDQKPRKELKKVFTPMVLKRDRDAIRSISKQVQNEETWKMVWKHMQQERRADIRADFEERQAHTDMLMQMSGQPVHRRSQSQTFLNSCSQRSLELSQHREMGLPRDVTSLPDFRGLVHADNEHALEALFPGSGHHLSVEFREDATRSAQAGYPSPSPARTPRIDGATSNQEQAIRREASLSKASIPASEHRLQRLGTRHDDDLVKEHSKVQFLPTVAPPPLNQCEQLLNDDFSPTATILDKSRVTGSFARTDHSKHPLSPSQTMEMLPPPTRSYVYPVMVPAARRTHNNGSVSVSQSSGSEPVRMLQRNESAPAILTAQKTSKKRHHKEGEKQVVAVCRELDAFEAKIQRVPELSNFFSTPRASGRRKTECPAGVSAAQRDSDQYAKLDGQAR